MITPRERIIQFADFKGFGEGKKGKSLRVFCIEIDVSHVYFSKKGAVGSDVLEKISSKFPDLNMDWVVTGRGAMILDKPAKSEANEERSQYGNDINGQTLLALAKANVTATDANKILADNNKELIEMLKAERIRNELVTH